jgi:CHAT domain-containing protein/tetratricopeptide (TPR) repeat protein
VAGKPGALLGTVLLLSLSSWSACARTEEPGQLFADAEALRLKYDKEASRLAIARFTAARTVWEQRGDKRGAARAAQRVGATYQQLGSLRESCQSYQAALSLAGNSADRLLESDIRSDLGMAQTLVSEDESAFEEAERHCQTAFALAKQSGSMSAEAKALNCLGEVAYYRQRLDQAVQFHDEARQRWDRLSDRRGQARTLFLQGSVYSDLSKSDEARTFFDRAQSLWAALGDTREEAIVLVAYARLHVRRGEYQEALNKFDRALTLLRPMGDVIWEGSSLTGVARVYLDMGDTAPALKHWERALEIFETAGLKNVAVDVLMSLGAAYLASGDDTNALGRFERAVILADELGIPRWKAFALRFIGVVHLIRQSPTQAQEYLQQSLSLQKSLGAANDPRLEARTQADLGEASDLLGDHERALVYFNDALKLSSRAGDRVTQARGYFGLARNSIERNHIDAARRQIEHALELAESLRTEVENRDLRASYLASVYRWHETHIDILMQLRRAQTSGALVASAFEASERARARSLLESLTEARVDLRKDVDADLLKREQEVRRAFAGWAQRQRQILATPARDTDLKALAVEHRNLEDRYNQIQAEIRSRSPRYAALAKPQPLSLKDVQKQVLDRNTLLLEYALGEKRSYLWVVSNADHSSYELAPRADIEQAAQKLYAHLTARLTAPGDARERRRLAEAADAQYWQEAARLSELLLAPAAKKLIGKRLLIVADGALQYLPFAALPIPGKQGEPVPMMVEHEIISLPSASALAVLRRENRDRKPGAAVAVFADPVFEADDPRLGTGNSSSRDVAKASAIPPGAANASAGLELALRDFGFMRDGKLSVPRLAATRHEADAIVGAAPAGTTLRAIDFDANRATAMSPELAKYRVVHFATHGVFNSDDPALSGLILSMFDKRGQPQDGFLRLHDIYGMRLPVELVVLSACNTALGKPVKGEGLVGIVRGFMYAGASRVIASLWKVDDDATGAMMGRFYEEMLKNNRSPAAALRQAQLAMWQQERWRPPFYWAAFALQGEWK